jgi:serine/threonine-protein kinase
MPADADSPRAQHRPTVITPQRWQRLQEIFERALELDPLSRPDFVVEECGEDAALREQVLSLLIASNETGDDFEQRVEHAIAGAVREADLPPGQVIGNYRVQRLLGRGGMGAVYLAERADGQYQQLVALKIVARGVVHDRIAGRFRSERQILARLNHPNIARLLDGGRTAEGAPYLVMEHVEGLRVDEYCERHELDVRARLRLFQLVCAAVHYAHQNLVVHRDLKPSNILVTHDGVPKLLDFGIAKLLDPDHSPVTRALTRVRDRVLTPEYASPEQVRGEAVGTASDVYGLGALLYELLTRRRPFDAGNDSFEELEKQICHVDPPAPSARVRATEREGGGPPRSAQLARALDGDLDNIVLKAMRKEPARRYASAEALAADIQSYLDGRPVQARPDTWTYRAGKFVKRNALGVASASGVALLVFGLVIFYTARLAAERDAAEQERQIAASVSGFMIEAFRLANPNAAPGAAVAARDVLDSAATRIERDLANQPRLQATLLRNMGEAYSGIGLWPRARQILERAVALERERFGSAHLDLGRALEELGHVQHNMGDFTAADRSFRAAWTVYSTLGRGNLAEGIRLLNSLGANLRAQHHFAVAIEQHRVAERYARALTPPDPALLGLALQGLATTYMESGDYRNGERYARESLGLTRGVIYAGYDLYANSLSALALSLSKQYRLEEAESRLRELVNRQIRMLGPDHVLVGRAWNNLGTALRAKGDYRKAEEALSEALRVYGAQREVSELDVAVAHHNIGTVRHEAGALAASMESLERSLTLKRRAAGARSAQVVSTLLEQAAVLREQGFLDRAAVRLAEAESVAAERLDEQDRRRALARAERGRLELASGDVTSAERSLREAVRLAEAHQDPARLADVLSSLGEALVRSGRHAEAREVLRRTLELRRGIVPAGHWTIADAESRLGEALSLLGETAEAERLLQSGLVQLRARRPAGDSFAVAAEGRAAEHARRARRPR